MRIERLELRAFRSYERFVLEPTGALTILVGPNAAGKTNAIEAIQLVSSGTSFRRPKWGEVVSWGAPAARIEMVAAGQSVQATVDLTIGADGTRSWRLNGVNKRRLADVTIIVPCVVFTPDDLSLAKGSAERRREGLDALGSQLSRAYGLMRTEYSRVVRQRNALLREGGGGEGLAAWDSQLVALGSKLVVQRRRLARRLGEAMIPAYEHLGDGEELAVGYLDACGLGGLGLGEEVSQEAAAEAMEAELVRRRLDERARGVTLVGPHRDDLLITIDGREARTFGSQGQQRTAALAWKMAEVIVAKELLRRSPVLLLDDVMSELDERRRSALTDVIQRETQTFVTTTNTGYFEPALLRSAEIVRVGGEA